MAKAKLQQEAVNLDEEYQKALAEVGLAGLLKRVDEYVDMDVHCTPTGFPQFDYILHPNTAAPDEPANTGMPDGRDIEFYSREPEVGKTSLALAVARAYQRQVKKVALIDVARTVTAEFLDEQKLLFRQEECNDARVYPLYVARAELDSGEPMTAEQVLDITRNASRVCDLVIVDDVAALIQASDLEKESEDADRTGGVSKLLTSHLRKTTIKRACVIWINQQRQQIGFSRPGMPALHKSMGGMAIPFFGSIRVDLSLMEKLSEGSDANKEVIGMRIKLYTAKNKVAPPFRSCALAYLNGEGFSVLWDYYELGLKQGIITKKGAHFSFGELKGQGKVNFYRMLRDNQETANTLMMAVDAAVDKKEDNE